MVDGTLVWIHGVCVSSHSCVTLRVRAPCMLCVLICLRVMWVMMCA